LDSFSTPGLIEKQEIFDFQYTVTAQHEIKTNTTLDARAEALALALGKSQSLKTLVVRVGFIFPEYLRQLVNVPSIKSLRFESVSLNPTSLVE
jgi:hypothetical protein